MLNLLAVSYSDSYNYDTSYYTTSDPSVSAAYFVGLLSILFLPMLIVAVLTIIGLWKVFTKAGKPGWASIVPIYNFIVLLEIVGRPTWWVFLILLGFIPFVGWIATLIIGIIVTNDLAKSFGKDVAYTLLLLFLPFIGYMILGFGSAKYHGPIKHMATTPPATPSQS